MRESKTNWDKVGVIIAIITAIVGFFGWNAASCLGCVSCGNDGGGGGGGLTSSVVSNPNDIDSTPTESEIQCELEQKTGKRYIENVKVLSANCDYEFTSSAVANTGDFYTHSLIMGGWVNSEDETLELYLNEEYKEMSFTAALSDEYRDTESIVKVSVLCDGEVVWTEKIKSGSLPKKANIDVSGVTVVEFILSKSGSEYDWGYIIFGDAYFTFAN